jgi:tetratricopeptide (TPR) repeat protein
MTAEEWIKENRERIDAAEKKQQEKQYERAIARFDASIESNPMDAETWFNKGNFLYGLERYVEALECYGKADELNPTEYHWVPKGNGLSKLERSEDRFNDIMKKFR